MGMVSANGIPVLPWQALARDIGMVSANDISVLPWQVLARDIGIWNESSKEQYNTVDPVFRDSYTLFKEGWSAIRFVVRPLTLKTLCGHCTPQKKKKKCTSVPAA